MNFVLVTGASRGIGRSIAIRLAQEKHNVIIGFKTDIASAKSVEEQCKTYGVNTLLLQIDVSNRVSVREKMNELVSLDIKLDSLINNAGINNPTDFDKISDTDWDEIINTNLKGPFICIQESLRLLNDGGSIVNIGSVSGQYGGPRTAHYAVSKAGLISLTQLVARFLAHKNIRCNIVAAGLIDSEMGSQGLKNKSVFNVSNNILLGRLGLPSEVADVVAYLVSKNATYITAQTINVNGGLYF